MKVAILDTGFCSSKLTYPKNISIKPSTDLTQSNNFDCNKLDKINRRLHGNWVLSQFINEIKTKLPIEISPFIIFDKNAKQSPLFWKRAFQRQGDFDLYVIAAGIKESSLVRSIVIKRPIIVAGATIGNGINYKSKLWPQTQYKNNLVLTIGSYSEKDEFLPARPDYTLVNSSEMKFFFSGGGVNDHFKGTSRATATAAARAINHCYGDLIKRKNLRECLEKYRKEIEIINDREKIKILTF